MGERFQKPMDNWGNEEKLLGRKPTKTVVVPPEYYRSTYRSEREHNYRTWKLNTSCDVLAYGDKKAGKITRFDVFGTGANSDQAVKEINEWINKATTKSKESRAWAKVVAFDAYKYGDEQLRAQDAQRKQAFKGPIPEGTDIPYKIVAEWPKDLSAAGVFPKDVFGVDLHQLDPIRMDDEVFIVPVGDQKFEILGFELMRVQTAEQHYINMIQKAQMKHFGATHPIHIILDETEGIDVQLEEAEEWWPNRTSHRIVPRLITSPMMNLPGSFRNDGLHHTQLSVIQQSIQLALTSIQYEKGHYDFCVRFGCLALLRSKRMPDRLIGKKYSKSSFLNGVNRVIQCEAKRWAMYDDEGDELLARLIAAEHLLEPTKSADYYGHTPETLEEIRPIFRGTWVFVDPNAPRMARPGTREQRNHTESDAPPLPGLIVVRIDWTDDEDGKYEKGTPYYYRLQPGQPGPKQNMDLKLLELVEGKAWQFSLESMTSVSRKTVSPALQDFAHRVRMVKDYEPCSKERFIENYRVNSMLKLQHSRLDKIFSFGFKKTCYKVELVGMWYPGQHVPCWGINVRHKAWIDHLAELECLLPGYAASWGGDIVSNFLPDDGGMPSGTQENDPNTSNSELDSGPDLPPRDGIRLLILKLMELSKIISNTGGVPILQTQMPVQQPENL